MSLWTWLRGKTKREQEREEATQQAVERSDRAQARIDRLIQEARAEDEAVRRPRAG